MFVHGSASLQPFLVVWIFLKCLGVIGYSRSVLSEGDKNYFKDWCLMNSQPIFLFITYLKPLCETNLDDSIDSGNFSVTGYLLLIRKDSSSHMHGLAIYVKEGLSFARDLSPENSADSCLCFQLALLHSVSYFFFLYRSPSSALCMVFDSISSNIDEVLSINPSANVFCLWRL